MIPINRKAAITAYKERKTIAGVYAVACAASGQAWVGQAANVETIQNRIWFTLRTGGHPNRSLQRAWNTFGSESLSFETLEQVDEESALARARVLKARLAHWREQRRAEDL